MTHHILELFQDLFLIRVCALKSYFEDKLDLAVVALLVDPLSERRLEVSMSPPSLRFLLGFDAVPLGDRLDVAESEPAEYKVEENIEVLVLHRPFDLGNALEKIFVCFLFLFLVGYSLLLSLGLLLRGELVD